MLNTFLFCWVIFVPVLAFSIFSVSNPVWSVLFLVFLFVGNSIVFFFFNSSYLGLVFIIVYVGAIAILFLFVIMLVNLRVMFLKYQSFSDLFIILMLSFFFTDFCFLPLYLYTADFFRASDMLFLTSFLDLDYRAQVLSDPITSIGFLFFNFYSTYLLAVGLLLLVILVGVVLLLRPAIAKNIFVERDVMSESELKNKLILPLRQVFLKKNS